jgi:Mg2+ and Co2+ transporter CorA
MNVGGLPWLTSSHGFWYVMALMAAAVTVALALISRTR